MTVFLVLVFEYYQIYMFLWCWSFQAPQPLLPPRPPGWDSSRILSVSLYTPASPAGPLIPPPLLPASPPLCSTVLYSQLPGLFIGPVSFPHLQGGRVVTVGPQSLSGILHGNENAPCWCRNLFLSLSRRTRMILFCCGCAVQYVVQR